VTKNTSFTEKIYIEVMSQIANPEFNIELLSNAMAMSRSSLNRKCQKEFERSANQYIVETRMQHAIKLLKENKYSISEIAYGTGYESLNYFSRSFKNHFGQSPSSFQMVS
jgi:AraC-like DNA-binding protein